MPASLFGRGTRTTLSRILDLQENSHEHCSNLIIKIVLASRYSTLALDYMFTNPVFRNSRFTKNAEIPAQTAARFTRVLLENEIITTREEAAGRKSAVYSFEPLLKLVRI